MDSRNQRLSYVPLEKMTAEMRAEMDRCAREGTPRPESSAVRAHVEACFWFFANSWRDLYRNGVLEHPLPPEARHGIFADRVGGGGFSRPSGVRGQERVDVAGRQCSDA